MRRAGRAISGGSRAVALAWLALGLAPATAFAQQRVVVLEFDGPGGATLRNRVVAALSEADGVELVANDEATAAADELGADLGSGSGRHEVARRLRVSAFVAGEVARKGARRTLTLQVYDGATGSEVGTASFTGKPAPLGKQVERAFWDELGSAIGGTGAPVEEEIEPEPEPEPEPIAPTEPPVDDGEPEEPDEPAGERPSPARLSIAFGATTRSLSYNDELPGLRDYCLGPGCDSFGIGPLVLLGARWYPAAHFTDGFAAHLGLDLRARIMFGVDSEASDGTSYGTSHSAFGVGVRLRVPLSDHELGVVLGYGRHAYGIEGSGGMDPGVPGVAYGFLRMGLDARFELSDTLSFSPEAAYLVPLSYGEIGEDAWFPHTGGGGVEADLALGLALADWIDVEVGFFLTRFFLSHSPEPTDPAVTSFGRVAGGSLDQQLGLRAGLVLAL